MFIVPVLLKSVEEPEVTVTPFWMMKLPAAALVAKLARALLPF
jgi:hypothetical protein